MLDKSLTDCGLGSVECAVHDVWKLWADFGREVPRPDLTCRDGFVVVRAGGHVAVGEAAVWDLARKMMLTGGVERGAARVLLILGLEFGGAKAEQILRDAIGLKRQLVAPGARPWLDKGFVWDVHLWGGVRVSAFARYLEECESRQLQRMIIPMYVARWQWLEQQVVRPWHDFLAEWDGQPSASMREARSAAE